MFLGKDQRIRRNTCLACGQLIVARPHKGDVTVCLACGHVMVFGRRAVLRNPTLAEQAKIDADPRVQVMLMAVAAQRRQRQ
jgi:hypothetical protein